MYMYIALVLVYTMPGVVTFILVQDCQEDLFRRLKRRERILFRIFLILFWPVLVTIGMFYLLCDLIVCLIKMIVS